MSLHQLFTVDDASGLRLVGTVPSRLVRSTEHEGDRRLLGTLLLQHDEWAREFRQLAYRTDSYTNSGYADVPPRNDVDYSARSGWDSALAEGWQKNLLRSTYAKRALLLPYRSIYVPAFENTTRSNGGKAGKWVNEYDRIIYPGDVPYLTASREGASDDPDAIVFGGRPDKLVGTVTSRHPVASEMEALLREASRCPNPMYTAPIPLTFEPLQVEVRESSNAVPDIYPVKIYSGPYSDSVLYETNWEETQTRPEPIIGTRSMSYRFYTKLTTIEHRHYPASSGWVEDSGHPGAGWYRTDARDVEETIEVTATGPVSIPEQLNVADNANAALCSVADAPTLDDVNRMFTDWQVVFRWETPDYFPNGSRTYWGGVFYTLGENSLPEKTTFDATPIYSKEGGKWLLVGLRGDFNPIPFKNITSTYSDLHDSYVTDRSYEGDAAYLASVTATAKVHMRQRLR